MPAAKPWDIGGPQPVVQQIVALGAIKGEVLDPVPVSGSPCHLLRVTGLFGDWYRLLTSRNRAGEGERAASRGVGELQVGDAMTLEGFENRFDTVVDCAFYHLFSDVTELKGLYARYLRRGTTPGAALHVRARPR